MQWISVRRAEGNGFYSWETQRKEVPAGEWTSRAAPQIRPARDSAAERRLLHPRSARRRERRFTVTRTSFYALGDGYTAWERYDHNRIDLVPERNTYKPGDTARIMIQSPWEQATALRHDRARRHPVAPAVRADVDAAVDHDSHHGRGHPERVRLRSAGQGAHAAAPAGRASATRRTQRSGQAVVPPRLRRAEGRGRVASG